MTITNVHMKAELLGRIEANLATLTSNLEALRSIDSQEYEGDLQDQLHTMDRKVEQLEGALVRAKLVNGSGAVKEAVVKKDVVSEDADPLHWVWCRY